jgi:hypothetical protein
VSWAEQGWQPIGGAIANGRLWLSLPQLTMSLSLDLPLGATRFTTSGTFVGATHSKAIIQNESGLVILDVARGSDVRVPPGPVGSGVRNAAPEACLAGTRLYLSGENGLLCLNPHTGRVLYFAPWPEAVIKFAGIETPADTPAAETPGVPSADASPRVVQFHPRFVIQSSGPASSIALNPRSAAAGETLYAVVAPDRVVALAPPKATAN